ncbi:unnamed protein product, partial [Scytosiphon promiscuus]
NLVSKHICCAWDVGMLGALEQRVVLRVRGTRDDCVVSWVKNLVENPTGFRLNF